MAQIALSWVLSKPLVTAPIVGGTKLHHLAGPRSRGPRDRADREEVRRLESPTRLNLPTGGRSTSPLIISWASGSAAACDQWDSGYVAAAMTALTEHRCEQW
jgi:hypothetical protein